VILRPRRRLERILANIRSFAPIARYLYTFRGDLTLLIGLWLIYVGCRQIYPAFAFAIPGAVLVWVALPSRPAFFTTKKPNE
jgi:hypothetical protein